VRVEAPGHSGDEAGQRGDAAYGRPRGVPGRRRALDIGGQIAAPRNQVTRVEAGWPRRRSPRRGGRTGSSARRAWPMRVTAATASLPTSGREQARGRSWSRACSESAWQPLITARREVPPRSRVEHSRCPQAARSSLASAARALAWRRQGRELVNDLFFFFLLLFLFFFPPGGGRRRDGIARHLGEHAARATVEHSRCCRPSAVLWADLSCTATKVVGRVREKGTGMNVRRERPGTGLARYRPGQARVDILVESQRPLLDCCGSTFREGPVRRRPRQRKRCARGPDPGGYARKPKSSPRPVTTMVLPAPVSPVSARESRARSSSSESLMTRAR